MDELGIYGLLSELQSSGTRPPACVVVPVGGMNQVPVVQKAGPEQHPAPLGRAGYEGDAFADQAELQQETRLRRAFRRGHLDPARDGSEAGPRLGRAKLGDLLRWGEVMSKHNLALAAGRVWGEIAPTA